jgi:endonuclease YncB( thermonuclease family)
MSILNRIRAIILCFAPLAAAPASAYEAHRFAISGPVEAELVSVIDGDTVMVNARPWPQQSISVLVRIRGIDTPELHAHCPGLRELALAARDVLAEALASEQGRLTLWDISGDKYFGRVVANVSFGHGRDAAALMLAAGLASPYDGGRKAREVCN